MIDAQKQLGIMMKKRNHKKTRRIWIAAFGEIPVDENGKSYDIHHINGDPLDDSLSNLMCLSRKEHHALHTAQGDYAVDSQHHFKSSSWQQDIALKQVANGKHPFQSKEMHSKRVSMQFATKRHSNFVRVSCLKCRHETATSSFTKHYRKNHE